MLVFLTAACGSSADDFGMDYANASCDFVFECPGSGYYDNRDECIDQLIDEMSADTHAGCEFDGDFADDCLELIRDATDTCDEPAAIEAVNGACAGVWSECPDR